MNNPSPRPDWKLPDPPHERWVPYAYCVGEADGWDLYWIPSADVDDPDAHFDEKNIIDWPFGADDFATGDDFGALGFVVG